MQKIEFSTGGFVVHKIRLNGSKFSAWYDSVGTLIDAERIDSRDRSYAPGRLQRIELERIGPRAARWAADRVAPASACGVVS